MERPDHPEHGQAPAFRPGQKVLPEGRQLLVDAPAGTPPAKRVAVAVHWRPQPGEPELEVRLTAWRYKEP